MFDGLLAKPLAFLSGSSLATIKQTELALLLAIGVLIAARSVRRDLIHGFLELRVGKALPLLLGDIAAIMVVLIGATVILTTVYQRDVTAILATGGLGLAVLGIALRDVILAMFNGAALNVENVFAVGDHVKIGETEGKVLQTTWRATTLLTSARRLVSIPNVAFGTASITNFDRPDRSEQRTLEICLDYDVTIESAERILLAGVLGALGVTHVAPPRVHAIRLERDGILYALRYVIADNNDGSAADHSVIKSLMGCLRDAGVGIAYPKQEVVNASRRVRVADRRLDRLVLVQQCALFRHLSEPQQKEIAAALSDLKLSAGAQLVGTGEFRPSLFIVGEGLLRRTRARADRIELFEERFVTTQFIGRRALLADLPHPGSINAVTDSLVFELTRDAFVAFLRSHADVADALATALASPPSIDTIIGSEVDREGRDRVRHAPEFYRAQIRALLRSSDVH